MPTIIFLLMAVIASPSSWAMHYEIEPHQDNLPTLNDYLNSQGIAKAKMKSKCKDDNCRYWLKIGNNSITRSKNSDLIEQSRYSNITYAIYKDDGRVYLASSRQRETEIDNKKLKKCLTLKGLAKGISYRGNPLCIDSDTLFAGNSKIDLPMEALYATIGISYEGHWQAAYIGTDYNIYVGNHNGFNKIYAGLHSQSDLKDILHIFPTSSSQALISVYIYSNKRNKSLVLYQLTNMHQKTAMQQKTIPILNTIELDAGLNPEVYRNKKDQIIISSTALTGRYQYNLDYNNMAAASVIHNPYSEKDMLELLVGTAIRHTSWNINQEITAPEKDGKKLAQTKYEMNQSLLKEISLQGKFMGNPIALQYAENEAVEELNDLEKTAAKKIYGYLGINDIFVGASTLRLEYRQETIGGIAEWEDESGTRFTAFENKYTQYSILKTEEQGMYKGFTYTQNNLPMSISFFDSSKSNGDIYFDPDLKIKKYAFTLGYDVSQYTNRYLFDYQNFYASPRISLGFFQYDIDKEIIADAELESDKDFKSNTGFSIDGSLELGYIYQRRSVDYMGAGFSLQAGISIDAEFYLNKIGEDSEIDDDEIAASFERSDYRYGPFARFNMMF